MQTDIESIMGVQKLHSDSLTNPMVMKQPENNAIVSPEDLAGTGKLSLYDQVVAQMIHTV